MEGSVDRSENRIRIGAQLRRVSDGALLWSSTYDRQAADLWKLQTEIASALARSLHVAGPPAAAHTPKPEAEDAVWKGEFDLMQISPESLAGAEAEFRKAMAIDPDFGAAYAFLAVVKYDRALVTDSQNVSVADRGEIESLLRNALRLDPRLAPARALLATLALQFDWDWKGAERDYREALAAGSNANAATQYAMLLCFQGRFTEADRQLRDAQQEDPIGEPMMYQRALIRLLEGRFAESREVARRLELLAPASLVPASLIASSYLNEHRPDLAAPFVKKLVDRRPVSTLQAALEVQYGHREEALRLIRPFEEQYPNTKVPRTAVAAIYAALKDAPNTVKWLNRAADEHEITVLNAGVLPVYAPVRNSGAFQALLARIGLAARAGAQ